MDQPTSAPTTNDTSDTSDTSGLLLTVDRLPGALDRDQRSPGAVTDNDGNDR